MEGYNVFRRDRKFDKGKTRGGGVLLYVREDLKVHEIDHGESNCEALFVSIKILGLGNLIVGVCYRSPTAGREEFESLRSVIRKQTIEAAVIMGDFNYGGINWQTWEATAEEGEFVEMLKDCFLTQHVMELPRDSMKTVDIVLSTEPGLVEEVEIGCPIANSDHYTIFFKIPFQTGSVKKKEIWCWNKADYEEICSKLESVQWDDILEGKDVQQKGYAMNGNC